MRRTICCVAALLALLVLVLPGLGHAADRPWGATATLSTEGKALVDVVVAPAATPRVAAAAERLAALLSQISGATFKVRKGDGRHGLALGLPGDFTPPRALGKFELGAIRRREDYVLKSHRDGVYLIGTTELAVEHGLWDFLYRLGYRQFFPGKHWEVIPQTKELAIAVDADEHPDFFDRSIWYGFGPAAYARGHYQDWCSKNRAVKGIELRTGHSYDGILARHRKEFAEHPEYLGLVDGKRTSTKFCISNQGLRRLVVDDALAQFAKDPALDCISTDPSDGGGWCECSECAKLGSISDRAVLLANTVAEAIEQQYPGKLVGMYAYNFHSAPPHLRVHSNVVISVATAYIKGDYTVEQLMADWQRQGASLGTREYYAVFPWDHDLPGQPRIANTTYASSTIPRYHALGSRFYSAESSDDWGPSGLGYYLAGRMLWNIDESKHAPALIDDFLLRAFAGAEKPMREFYRLIDGRHRPLVSDDLIGRMYLFLAAAARLAPDASVQARINDLVLYTHYVELWQDYSRASGEARQRAFEDLLRYAWQIRESMMVHVTAVFRDLPHRDPSVALPAEAQWQVPEGRNPWKRSRAFTQEEIERLVTEGIARHKITNFEPVSFSHDLVPAQALALPAVKPGNFGYTRGPLVFYTWIDKPPATIELQVTAGLVYSSVGDAHVALFPAGEAEGKSVAAASVPPNKQPTKVELPTTYAGLHRIELTDRTGGTKLESAPGRPLTLEASGEVTPRFGGRWTLYFYVPRGTQTVGGYVAGHGTLEDADGQSVYRFEKLKDYFSVPVAAGQAGRLWCWRHCSGQVHLLTVPPYLARSPRELLLPGEVVEADSRR